MRGIKFTFEEVVEIKQPHLSKRLDGMYMAAQTTTGYVELDSDGKVESLIIQDCFVDVDGKKLINTEMLNGKEEVFAKIVFGVYKK